MKDSSSTLPEAPLVSVSGVTKKFAKSLARTLLYGLQDIGREMLPGKRSAQPRLREDEFMAVDNISFELRRGEALGIIGQNGSGKSTLLKMLNGLIKPDAGVIRVRGKMAALVELGAGFDPILSGRENVYINAAILGLGREEVDEIMPRIVDFSGLGDFMRTPVKFYSSGMKSRLAYSVASQLSPDVFIVDEVLAVGDSEFQQKCVRNMLGYVEGGGALIFVSHSGQQIQSICKEGLVLDKGRQVFSGSADKALDFYCEMTGKVAQSKRKAPSLSTPDDTAAGKQGAAEGGGATACVGFLRRARPRSDH